jgi:single-strand DNA-binding protein
MRGTIIGNCTDDAVYKQLSNGGVLSVNVAENVGYGDNKTTVYYRVNIFGKRSEGRLKEFLTKGRNVTVIGEFVQKQYQKKDGTIGYSNDIRVDDIFPHGKLEKLGESKPVNNFDDFDDDISF